MEEGKMCDRDFLSDFHIKTVDKLLSISVIYNKIYENLEH